MSSRKAIPINQDRFPSLPLKATQGVVFFLLKTAFVLRRKKVFRKLNQVFHYPQS